MKRMIALFILSALLLTGCAANQSKPQATAAPSYRQVNSTEAVSLMEKETDYILLDVRRPDEYAQGHIPGAINIANETIGTTAPSELPRKDQLILIYCRSGNRSKQAAAKLAALGYTNIVEFGGINSWTGEIVAD